MIKSCTNILQRVEQVKFDDLLTNISNKRKQNFMKKLEELQKRNDGLPGVNSRSKFQDAYHRLEYFRKSNLYNVSNLIKRKNLVKPVRKKMTENQYTHLLKYLEKRRKKNLRSAAKNRFKTAERPKFSHFGVSLKHKYHAWEDYSHNPQTTAKLVAKLKKDMNFGPHRK